MSKLVRSVLLTFLSSGVALAGETRTNLTLSTHQSLNEVEAVEIAAKWGLTKREWREYEEIMAGKRGLWSPGIDPISALGINALTADERRHFANIYVEAEFERVEKELAFQRAVNASWQQLYPNTPRISKQTRSVSGGAIVRYGIVVSMSCGGCQEVLDRHFTILEQRKNLEGIDIYVVGSGEDDGRLRDWVKRHKLPLKLIQSGRVTVNHGAQYEYVDHFPVVYAKAEGRGWVQQ